jgi:hypothetical protein
MGRTLPPFSQFIEAERCRWAPFRRALPKADQVIFDKLFDCAKLHVLVLQWYFNLILVRGQQKCNESCCTGKIPTHRNFNGLRESTTVVLAGVMVSRPWPFETVVMAVLLEHQKRVEEMVRRIEESQSWQGRILAVELPEGSCAGLCLFDINPHIGL